MKILNAYYLSFILFLLQQINNTELSSYSPYDINKSFKNNNCFPTSYCGDNKIKCSKNGYCFYDIFDLYTNKSLIITCICNHDYDTLPNDDVYCCYERKSQFIAFLYETFIGFGAGHFYIGRIQLGIIKLTIMIFLLMSNFVIVICLCYKEDKGVIEDIDLKYKILNLYNITSIFIWIIWQLIDIIMFSLNKYKDSNEVELNIW